LSKCASHLKVNGLDPENQLSTDDFGGHLANHTNLSLKATLALGDWYWTTDGTHVEMQARAVVGDLPAKMLTDPATWNKWRIRARP
jgi:hypothetical protein